MNYYNENDPKAAAWLRELIAQGHIPPGHVDERSITEIKAHELTNYTQCHFFAGIGGWSLALQLAGWPIDRPVWTGSCPCQPFSSAGKCKGIHDERHLWPVFCELIRQCRPPVVFGEQVASKAGREWLAGVCLDLEGMAYRRAAADLCAAGVGAPHIRQRLYWVADTADVRCTEYERESWERGNKGPDHAAECSGTRGMADPNGTEQHGPLGNRHSSGSGGSPDRGRMEHSDSTGCEPGEPSSSIARHGSSTITTGSYGGLAHTALPEATRPGPLGQLLSGPAASWANFSLLPCTDGKTRRIESGTFPLAYGVSGRVGLLRGYGNAIVPQVAAEFIKAYQESKGSN